MILKNVITENPIICYLGKKFLLKKYTENQYLALDWSKNSSEETSKNDFRYSRRGARANQICHDYKSKI